MTPDNTPLSLYALGIAEYIAGTVLMVAALGFLIHGPIIRFIERKAGVNPDERRLVAEVEQFLAQQVRQ